MRKAPPGCVNAASPRPASAEDIHAMADKLHEAGLYKASVHARSLAHELERQPVKRPEVEYEVWQGEKA